MNTITQKDHIVWIIFFVKLLKTHKKKTHNTSTYIISHPLKTQNSNQTAIIHHIANIVH
jgi:hypothetical protein